MKSKRDRFDRRGMLISVLALTTFAQALDINVQLSTQGKNVGIFVSNVPAKEQLGAIKLRLRFKAEAGVEGVIVGSPTDGPWSQILPESNRTSNSLTLWAMAPNLGESGDSSSVNIMNVGLVLSSAKAMTTASDLIDSVIVEEALTPTGDKITVGQNITTTSTRRAPKTFGSLPVERMHGRSRTLTFTLGKPSRVRAYVSDPQGKQVVRIFDGKLNPGLQEITWDGKGMGDRPLRPGIYFLRLEAGTFAYDRKLELSP